MTRFRPLLVFVHQPKTGGTSFRHALSRFSPERHLDLYVDDTDFVYSPAELAHIFAARPEVVSVSSHFVRVFPPIIGDRECHYVTVLRDPRQQFMSYIRYMKKTYENLRDPAMLRYLPMNVARSRARDMAAWLVTQPSHVPFAENYATNYFSWYPWAIANLGLKSSLPSMSACTSEQWESYRSCRLKMAKQTLGKFFFVGIQEHLGVGTRELRRRCKQAGLPVVPAVHLQRENTTDEIHEDSSWLHSADEVGAKVIASQTEDAALYEWALQRTAASAGRWA
jgi:hypothetical protein